MNHAPAQHKALASGDIAVSMDDRVDTLAVGPFHSLSAQAHVDVAVLGAHGVGERPVIELKQILLYLLFVQAVEVPDALFLDQFGDLVIDACMDEQQRTRSIGQLHITEEPGEFAAAFEKQFVAFLRRGVDIAH